MREKSETYLNDMEVFSFRKTIVFKCVRWSGEMGDAMKSKKVSKCHIFTIIIIVQGMNVLIEVFLCNGFEPNEDVIYV
jgi:hypothetical protein